MSPNYKAQKDSEATLRYLLFEIDHPGFADELGQVLSSSLRVKKVNVLDSYAPGRSNLAQPPWGWLEIILIFVATNVATRVLSNIGDDIHSYFKNKSGEALKKKRNKKISEQKNVLSQPEPITAKFIIKVQENEAIGWFEGNNAEALGEAFKNAPQMFINFPQKLQLDNVQTTKVSPLYISSDDKKKDTYKYDVSKGLWLPKD